MNTDWIVYGVILTIIGFFGLFVYCLGVIPLVIGLVLILAGLLKEESPRVVYYQQPPQPQYQQYQPPPQQSTPTILCAHCYRQIPNDSVVCPYCETKVKK